MFRGLPEREVVRVWQYQWLDRTKLVTEGGEPIEVIYPGRVNDGLGADFCDAVIATGRGLVKGDIEIHVRSSSWREHGHHRDSAYNRVILHVVMWHNEKAATYLQNGGGVPVLALHKYVKSSLGRQLDLSSFPAPVSVPCTGVARLLTADRVAEFLDSAGEARFRGKAAKFETDLASLGAGQTLYQGMMGALGYSRNKLPFLELARRLPLHTLESMARDAISNEEYLDRQQALLLGTAGLLPSQRFNECRGTWPGGLRIGNLESLRASLSHSRVMSVRDWHLFRVRPGNSPERRLIAMSYLLTRYRKEGMLKGLVDLIKEVPVSRGYNWLEKGLVAGNYSWQQPSYGSIPTSRWKSQALFGPGRALEIIVNVLLPFTFTWGRLASCPELMGKTLSLYRQCPKRSENSIERHMLRQFGLSRGLVSSAQRQQGLIHIYRTLCTEGRCSDCSLSQLEAGDHV